MKLIVQQGPPGGHLKLTEKSTPSSTRRPTASGTISFIEETRMKRIALLFLLSCAGLAPWAVAQDRVAAGGFVDYFRLHQADTNFAGVGGRLGVGLGPHTMLEGEIS